MMLHEAPVIQYPYIVFANIWVLNILKMELGRKRHSYTPLTVSGFLDDGLWLFSLKRPVDGYVHIA